MILTGAFVKIRGLVRLSFSICQTFAKAKNFGFNGNLNEADGRLFVEILGNFAPKVEAKKEASALSKAKAEAEAAKAY